MGSDETTQPNHRGTGRHREENKGYGAVNRSEQGVRGGTEKRTRGTGRPREENKDVIKDGTREKPGEGEKRKVSVKMGKKRRRSVAETSTDRLLRYANKHTENIIIEPSTRTWARSGFGHRGPGHLLGAATWLAWPCSIIIYCVKDAG